MYKEREHLVYTKLMFACIAIVVFAAVVITPLASASPVLTEGGTALAIGSSVTATNEGRIRFTGGFSLECEEGHLQGTVTRNTGTSVAIEAPVGSLQITNAGGSTCTSPLGATIYAFTSKLCLETVKGTDNLTVTGCSGNIVFDLTVTGVTCKYEAVSWSATFTTNSTPATLSILEQPAKEVGGLVFCPDEGKLDMAFRLYTNRWDHWRDVFVARSEIEAK